MSSTIVQTLADDIISSTIVHTLADEIMSSAIVQTLADDIISSAKVCTLADEFFVGYSPYLSRRHFVSSVIFQTLADE